VRGRAKRGGRSVGSAGKPASPDNRDLTADEQSLLERLREVRTTLARRDKVPAYVVFADRTLRELARSRPSTRDQMAGVHGVGPAKLEKYADDFLQVLRKYI
jgi:ATP-dependent DNA helicase RecQ